MRTRRPGLSGDDPLATIRLANHLASNDNLARTTEKQNTQQQKLTIHKKAP